MPDHDPAASEPVSGATPPVGVSAPDLRLALFELRNYRRLEAVRLEVGAETTVLVGPNDSGKTSLVTALRSFLSVASAPKSDKKTTSPFTGYDLCGTRWSAINAIGEAWLGEVESGPAADDGEALSSTRQEQWERLVELMPSLDVWIDVAPSAWQRVLHLIPTLRWEGGLVGLRLRLEPSADGIGLAPLIEALRLAAKRSDGTTTLVQLLREQPKLMGRVRAYRLDPRKLDPAHGADLQGPARPQALSMASQRLAWGDGNDAPPLRGILRVDALAAQRGHGTEEADPDHSGKETAGQLSKQLVSYVSSSLDPAAKVVDRRDEVHFEDLLKAIRKVNTEMSTQLTDALKTPLETVRALVGYPNLPALQALHLRAIVNPGDALRHSTALRYQSDEAVIDGHDLPEHAIGLGYQNLLSMSFWLLQKREERLRGGDEVALPAPIHLVLMEEPEAHLHVQVQRVFIDNARNAVHPADRPDLSTQLVVSTHSSHLAHAVDFADLRYLRRGPRVGAQRMPTTEVVSLGATFSADPANESETRRFVRRYLEVQHNDLLFADGIIVVEGAAERILIPEWIRLQHPKLQSRYLSMLEVGGSHAHRFLPLLDRLQLPTLLVTDLDPVDPPPASATGRKKRWKRAAVRDGEGQRSANSTLNLLFGTANGKPSVKELLDRAADPQGGRPAARAYLQVSYQRGIGPAAACPTSLEDSIILTDPQWFTSKSDEDGPIAEVKSVIEEPDPTPLAQRLHELMAASNFSKGEFASELFMRAVAGEHPPCPAYIADGLSWLSGRLNPEPPAAATTAGAAIEPTAERA